MKKTLSFVLSGALLFSMYTSPVWAIEETTNEMHTQSAIIESDFSEALIAKADAYITLNNEGFFEISDYNALSGTLDAKELFLVEQQLARINSEVVQSTTTSSEDNVFVEKEAKRITIYSSAPQFTKAKEGVNKIEWQWFGVRVYLSKSTVTHILNAGVAVGATYLGIQFPGLGRAND